MAFCTGPMPPINFAWSLIGCEICALTTFRFSFAVAANQKRYHLYFCGSVCPKHWPLVHISDFFLTTLRWWKNNKIDLSKIAKYILQSIYLHFNFNGLIWNSHSRLHCISWWNTLWRHVVMVGERTELTSTSSNNVLYHMTSRLRV